MVVGAPTNGIQLETANTSPEFEVVGRYSSGSIRGVVKWKMGSPPPKWQL